MPKLPAKYWFWIGVFFGLVAHDYLVDALVKLDHFMDAAGVPDAKEPS